MHEEEASLKRMDLAEERVGLHERARHVNHARSPQKTPDCLAGHAIISGNLAKGFVVLTDTAHHVRPFFRWDAMVKLTWTWMLLCGDDRGNTAGHLFECEQSLIELAMRGEKVN